MTHSRWDQIAAFAGIAFVALLVVVLMIVKLPGGEDTNQVYADYFNEADRFTDHTIAAYLIAAAGFAFVTFLVGVRRRLLADGGDANGLHLLAFASGLLFVATLFVTGAAATAIPTSIEIGEEVQVAAESAHVAWIASIILLLYGSLAASAMVAALSVLVLKSAALPNWLAWTGFACAFLLLFGYVYLPIWALPLWVLATSVALLRPVREPRTSVELVAEPA